MDFEYLLSFLQGLRCPCVQSLLFARPLPAAALGDWLVAGGPRLKTYPPAPR